jgi:hypothetical protein
MDIFFNTGRDSIRTFRKTGILTSLISCGRGT